VHLPQGEMLLSSKAPASATPGVKGKKERKKERKKEKVKRRKKKLKDSLTVQLIALN
jgi:hypothetical protein